MSSDQTSAPSEALIQLISPDGYYTYLEIPKPSPSEIQAAAENVTSSFIKKSDAAAASGINEDLVKKNYRKLSLKHHPDKRGGDADTFRVLNRAQKVLMNPKLRQQYDILGLDLDDDDDEHDNLHAGGDGKSEDESTTAQGIVHDIASMVMASIMHLGVRTVMMGVVSVVVVRYRITLVPALLFLAYIGFRIFQTTQLPANHPGQGSMRDLASPILLATGLVLMYYGRGSVVSEAAAADGGEPVVSQWSWTFWLGEALVIAMFTYNSIGESIPRTPPIYAAIGVFSIIVSLWFRGKFWNYVIVVAFELMLILFVVLAFPVMEMLLEAILNEKLRKVGDKVRAHQKQLESYYANKELGKGS